jgi:ribosome-associated protein
MVHEVARLAAAKKAGEIVVLGMADAVSYTDYFVICSGDNPRQTRAIAEAITDGLRTRKIRPTRIEGVREGEWILIDLIDIVIHIFTPASRDFYRLESLWNDVPREVFDEAAAAPAARVRV